MTEDEARLYFVASRDDPFVASWVAVLDQHKLPARATISPYDWWDSFQEFYHYDLISDDNFRHVSPEKSFFGKQTPRNGAIQDALQNVRILRSSAECDDLDDAGIRGVEEVTMSDKKPFPIFDNPTAIATKSTTLPSRPESHRQSLSPFAGGATQAPARMEVFEKPQLRSRGPGSLMSPIAPGVPAPRVSSFLDPTPSGARDMLPCTTNTNLAARPDPRAYPNEAELTFEIRCCGRPLPYEQDDGDVIDPGDKESHMILEILFHGQCEHCNKTYHFSVATPMPRDTPSY
jgi:hypothetical protein